MNIIDNSKPICIAFGELIRFFIKSSETTYVLDPFLGSGNVKVFKLEHGLYVRLWDCSFDHAIELVNEEFFDVRKQYYTLAFFLDLAGVKFAHHGTYAGENKIWDTALIPADSDYKIAMDARAKVNCFSVSFSKKWLDANNINLSSKPGENQHTSKLFPATLQSMTVAEKKLLSEIATSSFNNPLGSFYLRSAVLKIVCDFFYKIRLTEPANGLSQSITISDVERHLCSDLSAALPNLKALAEKFSRSEVTLKRHFRKKFGVNMSNYFINKKMEYARKLLGEGGKTIAEVANIVGYKNVHHFESMLKKHK
ncbi:AraC family transcriptional regulator [Segetibacter sp. 3557_3]|uniref:helix-turn-helix domain-containing protein n=1 Tax=Segetibacter sp. 3557_3 TaxID=2547429 RepID=UPI0010588405|nr:AraC family transcriptional regulator [Segetibacter sp. 3557_3]TDH24015.1 AraC family transcriptional regulator [Segetibacter sp. 3557_3]